MAVFLKPKEPKQAAGDDDEAIGQYKAFWDEKSYLEIERQAPELARLIERLVKIGRTPDEIWGLTRQCAPQRWPEIQQVKQAARHVARGQG